VLFVGRLVANKGCDHLIRAMARLRPLHPEAELVVIGDGPERPALEALAAARLERFRFLGTQAPDGVKEWMSRARVFCVPSVTVATGASEGFGLAMAEAQAMALPVVSFRTGGIPDAVEDGVTGHLLAEGDEPGLAMAIAHLLSDRATWQRFSAAARERVVRLFDLRTQTEKLEALYDEVVAAHGPAAGDGPG
jgi:colanic acid/amylovoran biosynthesis glycosyltransferase